ncbi:MAG: hypothetical protein M1812_000782 [Candelaria pacifica]|nr:MAG: hypothetical protein M1812_000782 [Candelaria pacifica]
MPNVTGDLQSKSVRSSGTDHLYLRYEGVDTGTRIIGQQYSGDNPGQDGMYTRGQTPRVPSVTGQSYSQNGQFFSEHTTPYQHHSGVGFRPEATFSPIDARQILSPTEGRVPQYEAFNSEDMLPFQEFYDQGSRSSPNPQHQFQQLDGSFLVPGDSAWFTEWLALEDDTSMRQPQPVGAQYGASDFPQALPHMENHYIGDPQTRYPNGNCSTEQSVPHLSKGMKRPELGPSLTPIALGHSTLEPSVRVNGVEFTETSFSPMFPLANSSQQPLGNAQTSDSIMAEGPSMNGGPIDCFEQISPQPQAITERVTSGLRDLLDPRQSLRSVPRNNPQWKRPLGLNFTERRIRPGQPGHFPLFKLPPEIRNMVYRHIFVSHNGIGAAAIAVPQFFRAARSFLNRNFLLTSRQVHKESAHIFYCENLFAFAYVGAFLEFLKRLSKKQRQLLTKLRLSYSHGNIQRALTIILTDCHHLHGLEVRIRSIEGGPLKWTWNAAPILNPIDVVRGFIKEADVKLGPVITVREERDEPRSWVAQSEAFPDSLQSFLFHLGNVPTRFRSEWNPSKYLRPDT